MMAWGLLGSLRGALGWGELVAEGNGASFWGLDVVVETEGVPCGAASVDETDEEGESIPRKTKD